MHYTNIALCFNSDIVTRYAPCIWQRAMGLLVHGLLETGAFPIDLVMGTTSVYWQPSLVLSDGRSRILVAMANSYDIV